MSVFSIIKLTISLILVFCSIFIAIWGLNLDSKLSKATPKKYRIIKAFAKDKKTEEPDASKAWYYLIKLDTGEDELIRKRDYVSQAQTEIYVQSYKNYHQMYREHRLYRSKEDYIAMLRPSKRGITVFIICIIICLLSMGNTYEQRYSSESQRLQKISEEKRAELAEVMDKYVPKVKDLETFTQAFGAEIITMFISNNPEINISLRNIYVCDAALMWYKGNSTIAQVPDVKFVFSKLLLKKQYKQTEIYINSLQDVMNGKITKEEAAIIAEETDNLLRKINVCNFCYFVICPIIVFICWLIIVCFIIRFIIYKITYKKVIKNAIRIN